MIILMIAALTELLPLSAVFLGIMALSSNGAMVAVVLLFTVVVTPKVVII